MRIVETLGGTPESRPPDEQAGRRTSDRLQTLLDFSRLLSVPSLETLLAHVEQAACAAFGASRARVLLPRAGEPAIRSQSSALDVAGPVLSAPLRDLDGHVIGVLEVERPEGWAVGRHDVQLARLMAEHTALAVQRFRLQTAALEAESLRREIELAHAVQTALLPTTAPSVPGLESVGWTRAASLAGGDCFDYWALPDGRLALFLGDASGHGLAAALVIAQVRALVRVLSEMRGDPDWLLARVNARLTEDLEPSRFVTAFVGCLSRSGELCWCSAGQGPVFVRAGARGAFEPLQAQCPPLGVDADLRLECADSLRLGRGGRVAVFSDGVLDAANDSGQTLGPQRIKTVLDNTEGLPLESSLELVRDVLVTWQGTHQAADDQSILMAGMVE